MVFFLGGNLLRLSIFVVLILSADVSAVFPAADVDLIQQLADKFSVTTEQQNMFLSKAQNLVSQFNLATTDQRSTVITSIEDARYGGTMVSAQPQLDTLLATAKATPAGIQTTTGTTTPSATDPATVQIVVATYLDRIASLSSLIDTFRAKKPTESDKSQVLTLINALFADRGESFADERKRFSQIISDAKMLIYRDDAATRSQLDGLVTQLATVVPFDVQLATQKKLYSVFQPLDDKQKARVLKHFQEMASMVSALTDISLNNDFYDLLQFADVAFFRDDLAAHATMSALLAKTTVLDPIFAKSYGEIISTLKAQAPTLSSSDLPDFMKKVEMLVMTRYGNKVGDNINKSTNFVALQDFLNTLINLPPFAFSVDQLSLWLASVKADNLVAPTATFYSRLLTYSDSTFMTQTKDATKRAAFMLDLEKLVNDRYGDGLPGTVVSAGSVTGVTRDTTYKALLLRLLSWISMISWFSDSLDKINSYIAMVNQDPAVGPFSLTSTASTSIPTSTTITPVGTFGVVLGGDVSTQLTQLEQSLNAISSDNHRELFILSLYDVVGRKSAATTVDVGRMRALATTARSNVLLGTTYANFCSFILAGVDSDFNIATRNQLYVDFLARVAGMTNPVASVQQAFLRFSTALMSDLSVLSASQRDSLGNSLQQVKFRTFFTAEHVNDVKELYDDLVQRLAATGTSLGQVTTQTTPASNVNSTGAVVLESATSIIPVSDAVLPTSGTATPSVVVAPQVTAQQQQQAAAALLNGRMQGWR